MSKSESILRSYDKRFGPITLRLETCGKCGRLVEVKEREYQVPKKQVYWCNISCANSRQWTAEQNARRAISNKIAAINMWKDPEHRYKIYNRDIARETISERELKAAILATDGWEIGDRFAGSFIITAMNLSLQAAIKVDDYDNIGPYRDQSHYTFNKRSKEIADYCIRYNWFLFTISVSYLQQYATADVVKVIMHILTVNDRKNDHSVGRIIKLGNEYK